MTDRKMIVGCTAYDVSLYNGQVIFRTEQDDYEMSPGLATAFLSPEEARDLATMLTQTADEATLQEQNDTASSPEFSVRITEPGEIDIELVIEELLTLFTEAESDGAPVMTLSSSVGSKFHKRVMSAAKQLGLTYEVERRSR